MYQINGLYFCSWYELPIIVHLNIYIYVNILAKQPLTAALSLSSGGAAFGGGKKMIIMIMIRKTDLGRLRRPTWSYNFRRDMRILNMCLVLKLDNGKGFL